MAVPVLSYGCELWTTSKKQDSKIHASEMSLSRGVKRCSKPVSYTHLININGKLINNLRYANDILIMVECLEDLQPLINSVVQANEIAD